jgi:type III secretion system low calcium response chaperone LcrH/SycD
MSTKPEEVGNTLTPEQQETIRTAIKEVIEKMPSKFPMEDKKKHEELLMNVFEKGMTPQKAMGFDDNFMEYLYTCAYSMFQSGKYNEARELFLLLMKLNPGESKYAFSLGCCYKKQEKWHDAAIVFIGCYYREGHNPIPLYHAADCMIKLNSKRAAIMALEQALDSSRVYESLHHEKKLHEHEAMRKRAELLIKSLSKDLEEDSKTPKEEVVREKL